MKLFLTSDTHLGHNNIIKYCNRPFASCEEMDKHIVEMWNRVVGKDDLVLHGGDVAMGGKAFAERNASQLNGYKLVTRGNHDSSGFCRIYRDLGWCVLHSFSVEDVFFAHRPHTEIPSSAAVKLVVHGHSHGKFEAPGFLDIGVDALGKSYNYAPVPAEAVLTTSVIEGVIAVFQKERAKVNAS